VAGRRAGRGCDGAVAGGQQVFTVRQVYAEMLAAATRYAESTVFKPMQRIEAQAGRARWIVLEQTGAGFRISSET